MTRGLAAHTDRALNRTSLGRLLRNQEIVVETTLSGRETPFARTTVLWSGDVTTQICARRCPPTDGCACGLTGEATRWPSILPLHQRDLQHQAIPAFRQARRLSRRLKLWAPLVATAITVALSHRQGDLPATVVWSLGGAAGFFAVPRIGLLLARRWLFRRTLAEGLMPTDRRRR